MILSLILASFSAQARDGVYFGFTPATHAPAAPAVEVEKKDTRLDTLSFEAAGPCILFAQPPPNCRKDPRCKTVVNDSHFGVAMTTSTCSGTLSVEDAEQIMVGVIDSGTGRFVPVMAPRHTYYMWSEDDVFSTEGHAYAATFDPEHLEITPIGVDSEGNPVDGWVYDEAVSPKGRFVQRTRDTTYMKIISFTDSERQ